MANKKSLTSEKGLNAEDQSHRLALTRNEQILIKILIRGKLLYNEHYRPFKNFAVPLWATLETNRVSILRICGVVKKFSRLNLTVLFIDFDKNQ